MQAPWIYKDSFPLPADFPFALMEARGLLKSPIFHMHDCLEINWVAAGQGVNYIQDREYPLAAGQVYLINNFERHIAISDGTLDMKIIIFEPSFIWEANPGNYEYLLPFYRSGPLSSNLAALDEAASADVAALFARIGAEWNSRERGYELVLRAKLMELLALLYRQLPATLDAGELVSLQSNYEKIRPSVEYINEHFTEPITLETLAAVSHMSRTYFSTLFKKIMNVNVGAYVEKVRISRACLLLATTGLSVTEVALESGFSNLSSFNAAFKKAQGTTPAQYRKNLPL